MSLIIIPWRNDLPAFKQVIVLDGQRFGIDARWNITREYWTIDLLLNNTVLLAGLKLVLNVELLSRHRYDVRLPPGHLLAVDTSDTLLRIGRDDMGTKANLFYEQTV